MEKEIYYHIMLIQPLHTFRQAWSGVRGRPVSMAACLPVCIQWDATVIQTDPTWIGIWGCIFCPIPHTSGCMGNRSDRIWVRFRTHRSAQGLIRIALASHSAPIGREGGPFGSQLRPIQHPSRSMDAGF